MNRVHIFPHFDGPDKGDGGVRKVWEGQMRHLPAAGWTPVTEPEDADVIAAHITVPDSYLNRFPRTPLVMHCHGMYNSEYEWENWAIKANELVMELARVADIITVPSEWVAQMIRRHTMRRPVVIPHGVDLDEWTIHDPNEVCTCPSKGMVIEGIKVMIHLEHCPGEETRGDYVFWGKTRLDSNLSIDTLDFVAAAMPDVEFRSTFGAPLANLKALGRMPYAVAKKELEHASAYLATARETFGIQTLEALASGVPVVGWRWGATPDLIIQGENGWLSTPGDYEDLQKGLRWALGARHDGKTPKRCRATAEAFPWQQAADMYAEVYSEALAEKRKYA